MWCGIISKFDFDFDIKVGELKNWEEYMNLFSNVTIFEFVIDLGCQQFSFDLMISYLLDGLLRRREGFVVSGNGDGDGSKMNEEWFRKWWWRYGGKDWLRWKVSTMKLGMSFYGGGGRDAAGWQTVKTSWNRYTAASPGGERSIFISNLPDPPTDSALHVAASPPAPKSAAPVTTPSPPPPAHLGSSQYHDSHRQYQGHQRGCGRSGRVPYPTLPNPSPRPFTNRGHFAGILGPPPSQFYASSEASYTPTNIEQALHTMTLNPDQSWYLDTGATNHMSHSTGTLSHYFNNSIQNSIVVGNGQRIPTLGTGYTTLQPPYPPLHLNNILIAPKLIKNLLSVRRLTTDNNISIEIDRFGFLVKDYQTRIPILRCDSTWDLYPLTPSSTSATTPSTFAALSQDLWHRRLGQPGSDLLHILNKQNVISFRNNVSKRLCQSCVFGKQVKLPFYASNSVTCLPFDIVHSDLWISPTISSGGHRYYIVFLDDYTNYVWTFPLANKSSVYSIFLKFHSYLTTQFERGIKSFQCDNGTEYNNKLFHAFCSQHSMFFLSQPLILRSGSILQVHRHTVHPHPLPQNPLLLFLPAQQPSSSSQHTAAPTPVQSQPSQPPLQVYTRRPKPTTAGPSHHPPSPPPPPPPPPPPTSLRTMTTRSMSGLSKPKTSFNLHTTTTFEPIPRNPIEALTKPVWFRAMTDEFNALIEKNTWELVPRRPDMNLIRCMWIFKHKTKSDGSLERYKARLVCDGRSQQVGIDFHDTFSPVVKPATIRTVLSIALLQKWDISQLDVKTAFLHGNLLETVYMHQPMGFRHPDYPHHKYAQDILARAKMTACNPVQTPVDTSGIMGAHDGDSIADPTHFRSLAGALKYLTFTRPDISYAGLYLRCSPVSSLIAYIDADWAGCPDTRLIGEASNAEVLCNTTMALNAEGEMIQSVSYIGGLLVLMVFKSNKEAVEFIQNKKYLWEKLFTSVELWKGKYIKTGWIVQELSLEDSDDEGDGGFSSHALFGSDDDLEEGKFCPESLISGMKQVHSGRKVGDEANDDVRHVDKELQSSSKEVNDSHASGMGGEFHTATGAHLPSMRPPHRKQAPPPHAQSQIV
ncbi:hypothetical protein E3N88_00584 [Mikania micrantha]|uniref:Integrase catalytic domain-containing protein n=1 Tax=Mikania micrantha TaxID=192012 RepID=A0A5N6Q0M5_9ASTR|nr:hypothetical protein E3N88_00584 [Mikania micrantha]